MKKERNEMNEDLMAEDLKCWQFTVELCGYGDTPEEAWEDIRSSKDDPILAMDMPPAERHEPGDIPADG